MGNGVLYKYTTTSESKSICKKYTTSTESDGLIKHYDTANEYMNYPMEQYFTATFDATWSQGWLGNGTRLDDGVWQGNILTASTSNYRGMFGFNQGAIQAFLGSGNFGNVTSAKLFINCYETTVNGSPDVQIGKHSYSSKPSGTWTGQNVDWGDQSSLHVPNQQLGGYMINLNPTQITLIDGRTAIGGFALRGATTNNEDHGKFNGVNSYNTRLEVTVLK